MCPHAELLLGRLTALDPERQTVDGRDRSGHVHGRATSSSSLALGSVARALPIPGLAEHALGFKDLAGRDPPPQPRAPAARGGDGRTGRRRAAARELTFVFVGAGYAGVEALAELADLVRDALRYYPALRASRSAGSWSTRRRRSCPRSRRGSASTPPSNWQRSGSRSARRRRSNRVGPGTRRPVRTAMRIATHTLVWTAGVSPNRLLAAARPARRRARSRQGRRQPASRRPRGSLGARRLRTRAEPCDDGRAGSANVPACPPPGPPAGEEPERRRRSRTVTARSVRWRHSAATRGSPSFSASRYEASWAGS